MSRIAIMQGRLVPPEADRFQAFPRQQWRNEFGLAAEACLDAIEWIYDQFGEDVNPLATDEGVREMKALQREHGVGVVSVCADYFMDRPMVRANGGELAKIVERLEWLVTRCRVAGIERIVLPFVDQSRIENEHEAARVADIVSVVLPKAEENSVELHLETSLAPGPFKALIDRLPHPWLNVNYDSGNSASLGYDPIEEFTAYGSRIGSVHVKDRLRGGSTVPLGTGDTDLKAVFNQLDKIGYRGDYVLQVARSEPNHEVDWAKQNRAYVLEHLRKISTTYSGGLQ